MQNNGSNNGFGAGSDNGSGNGSPVGSNQGSRLPGFYKLSVEERRELLRHRADLSEQDLETLDGGGLDTAAADRIVENVVGVYALPLGLGLNFRVNGRDVLVPMAVEEPSVIAAASNAARMVREGGGFVAEADDPVMTAQIEIVDVADPEAAVARLEAAAGELLELAHATLPRLVDRGGGAREIEVRAHPRRVVVHVHVDCRNAMGANMVNTVAEALAAARGRAGRRALRAAHPHQPLRSPLRAGEGARPAERARRRPRSTARPCATGSSPPRASPRTIPTAPPPTTRGS